MPHNVALKALGYGKHQQLLIFSFQRQSYKQRFNEILFNVFFQNNKSRGKIFILDQFTLKILYCGNKAKF